MPPCHSQTPRSLRFHSQSNHAHVRHWSKCTNPNQTVCSWPTAPPPQVHLREKAKPPVQKVHPDPLANSSEYPSAQSARRKIQPDQGSFRQPERARPSPPSYSPALPAKPEHPPSPTARFQSLRPSDRQFSARAFVPQTASQKHLQFSHP